MKSNGSDRPDDCDMSGATPNLDSGDGDMDPISREASEWLMRFWPGFLAPDDPLYDLSVRAEAFSEWVDQSPAHGARFRQMSEFCRRFNRLSETTVQEMVKAEAVLRALNGRRLVITAKDQYFRGTVFATEKEVQVAARRWVPEGDVTEGKGQEVGPVQTFGSLGIEAIHIEFDPEGKPVGSGA